MTDAVAVPEIEDALPLEAGSTVPLPGHVARRLAGGTFALGAGVFVERGLGFAANILAARWGGASTFGAYSLAVTTASQISTYAAGGIGATSARFSGKYPQGSAGYSTLARALAVVSLVSAALAAGALALGAAPIAHLLRKPGLTLLLQWTAVSAAGMILLECARGFFTGQRRLQALLLLSVLVGVGMIAWIPLAAATHRPIRMIVAQGAITTGAVAVCLLLGRPLGLHAPGRLTEALPMAPILREVWSFGLVQLAGLIGMNLAGWWLTTLVARADTTLVQVSYFAIANQLRNLVGLGPGLLTESSYALMGGPAGEARTADQVMAVCTYLSTVAALLLAACGMLVLPWGLHLLYGRAYLPAAVAIVLGLAIAVVHMGNSPAAARLTIVSLRTTGVINTVWAIFVAGAGTAFLLRGGSAAGAMLIYLAGHVLSAVLVLLALDRRQCVPRGMGRVFALGTGTMLVLAAMAWRRELAMAEAGAHAGPHAMAWTAAMAAVLLFSMLALLLVGRAYQWLPDAAHLRNMMAGIRTRAGWPLERGGRHGA
ncbi:MAG TPA: oligosaccharide flippase family protein [Acidobacteriaceae bacterium]